MAGRARRLGVGRKYADGFDHDVMQVALEGRPSTRLDQSSMETKWAPSSKGRKSASVSDAERCRHVALVGVLFASLGCARATPARLPEGFFICE